MLLRTFLASRGAMASLEQQGLPLSLVAASSSLLFSTKTAPDYSLAMKKADEISSNVVEAPKGEIGAYAGVPPETFKRAVSRPPTCWGESCMHADRLVQISTILSPP